jgi:hypothetical protein
MVTEGGLNFTLATSDSLSWYGYKTDQFSGAISFGDATLVATLRPVSQNVNKTSAAVVNQVWLFHFPALASGMVDAKNVVVIDSVFSRGNHLGTLTNNADFSVIDAAWSKGAFWLACTDGGLVRLDIATDSLVAFFPGRKNGFPPSNITDKSVTPDLSNFPDSAKRVIGVTVQDSSAAAPVVWVVTPAKLWKFSYRDSSWDSAASSLADTTLHFVLLQCICADVGQYSPAVCNHRNTKKNHKEKLFRRHNHSRHRLFFLWHRKQIRGAYVLTKRLPP